MIPQLFIKSVLRKYISMRMLLIQMLQFYESHLVFRPDPANEEIVDEEENTAE